jgi:hypothetical protein
MLGNYTPPQPPPGIWIGNYKFSAAETVPMTTGPFDSLLDGPGLYAILQPQFGVPQYGILYVGESQNIRTRATATHENYSSWKQHSSTIYRAFFPMPGSTQEQRQAIESTLISTFNPPCNERLSFALSRLYLGR